MVQTTSAELSIPVVEDPMLCCYRNGSDRPQILRISNIPQGLFAAIVFPQQRYLFTAGGQAILEIHPSTTSSSPVQRLPCQQLRVKEPPIVS